MPHDRYVGYPVFNSLCEYLGITAKQSAAIWGLLEALYTAPNRYYHNLQHVVDMAEQLNTYYVGEHYPEVAFACWFHDAIYNTKRKDNEKFSAHLADECLNVNTDLSRKFRDRVFDLVMVTQTHNPTTQDEKWICDLDLMRLGGTWDAFKLNCEDIRKEYYWVSDKEYELGRKSVLKGFLDRPQLYYTDTFRYLEAEARANLKRAIEEL